MKRTALICLGIVFSAALPAAAVEKASEQVLPFYGSFGYSVPIEVPPFRGLEPRLAFSYGSEARNAFLGVGWNLSGISTIERANPGRGTPNWDANDVYLLDGQELYPCQPGSVSPSCTSGGNFSGRVENYLKIRYDGPSNSWTVWSKTGVRTVFTPVYDTTSGTLRWGQTSVIDTKDNTVAYLWQCSGGDCYPSEIQYGSYRVTFFRETRPDVISFATGPGMGHTTDRLLSVVEWLNGVSNIRAYKLSYDLSSVTGQSLLASIQQYGKDVIHSSGVITGGSALPPYVFTYQGDPSAKSFVDFGAGIVRSIVTENVSWAERTNTSEAGSGNSLQKVNGGSTAWDAGGSSTRAITSGDGYVEATSTNLSIQAWKRWGLSREDESVDPNEIDFAFEEHEGWVYVYEDGVLRGYWPRAEGDLLRIEVTGNVVRYKQNGNVLYTSSVVPVYPLRVDASIYQMLTTISNVVISGRLEDVSYWCWGNTFLQGDFNGDGRTDQACYSNAVQTTRVKLATGTGFAQPAVWYSGPLNLPFTGDFNGDGKTDLVSHDSWTGEYSVALSSGTGFGSLTSWGIAAVGPVACNGNQAISWTGDFNGDGVLDLACRLASATSPQAEGRVLVGLSTGSQFSFSIWTTVGQGCDAPAYERTGAIDFTGDGKDDYFCITQTGFFFYYPSTGSSFGQGSGYHLTNDFCGASEDYVFGDFNGDGRTDAHCKLNGKIALSSGADFVEQGAYGEWCAGDSQATDLFAADVDGDGASELVCNNADIGSQDIQVRKWSGSELGTAETWRADWCEGKIQAGDYNGDSKTDLYCDDLAEPVAVAGTTAVKANLMTSARNPIGGTVTGSYTVASNFQNQTPTSKYVVSAITRDDGRGGISTKTYAYAGALMDHQERRFLGFQYARETKPCIAGEAACPYVETWFLQDPKTGPKPQRVDARDGAGKLFRSVVREYSINVTTLPYTSIPTGEWQYTYEGATAECTVWPCEDGRRLRVTHGYDDYGNETTTTSYGDYDTTGDESTVSRVFVPNTTAYIVGLVAQETVYAGIGTQGSQLRQIRNQYDGQGNSNTPPTYGYVTRVASWLDTTGEYANHDLAYDGWGNLTQDKDPTQVATNFTYDSTYHLFVASKYVIPAETTSFVWDAACSQPSQETNPNSQAATSTYDAFCRPWQVTGPSGSFQTTTYPDYGNPQLQNVLVETPPFDPNDGTGNYRERKYFDGFGRTWRTARKAPNGGIYADTAYNARGGVTSQTAPYYWGDSVYTTTYSYDALDRRTETRYPDDTTSTTTYGLWEQTRTDPEGHDDIWTYDAFGRVIAKEPEGHLTTFEYDLLGNQVGMTDPEDNHWTWVFDSLGRTKEQHDTDSGLTTFQLDLAGRLRFKTDAKGQTTQWTYSTQTGRLATKANAAGTVQYTYSEPRTNYYNVGQLTTITDPSTTQRFDYDKLGRQVHMARVLDGTTYDVSRGYDSGGRLLSIVYPGNDTISGYTYDTANRLKTIGGVFTNADYDASDRPTSRTNVNGTATTWSYDPYRGWLDSIATTGSKGTIQNLQYTRNDDGLVEGVTSPFPDEGWSYGYDPWHQLTSATNTSNPTNDQTFQYNDAGGITYNSLVGSYLYQDPNHAHAPSSVAGQTLSYDLNGNLVSGGNRAITWNANNQPTYMTTGSIPAWFTYDGSASRVKYVSGATTSRYPFGDDYEIANGVVTRYITAPNMGVIAKRVGSAPEVYWLHTDSQRSIQAITDSGGNIVQRRTYRPYGDKIADSTSHVESRGYIDQRQDPGTALTYLHARYYDPRLGVFVSADPSSPDLPGVGPHRYVYGLGSPPNGADRSGKMITCNLGIEGAFSDGVINSHGMLEFPITISATITDCTYYEDGIWTGYLLTNGLFRNPRLGNDDITLPGDRGSHGGQAPEPPVPPDSPEQPVQHDPDTKPQQQQQSSTTPAPVPIAPGTPGKLGAIALRSVTLYFVGSFITNVAGQMECGLPRQALHGVAGAIFAGGAVEGGIYAAGGGIAAFGATPVIGPAPGAAAVVGGSYLAGEGLVSANEQFLEMTRQAGPCAP